MSLKDSIINFFKGKPQAKEETPEGYCPNCWGRQEYSGQFFDALHTEKVDLNNVDAKQGWIQAYATRHLEGIKLKEDNGELVCSACKVSYKK